MRIRVSSGAARDLRRLPKEIAGRVVSEIESLAKNPRPHGSLKLSDYKPTT